MSKPPNMWRDQDEFSIARRTKFTRWLMRSIEKDIETRPEPEEKPWSENAFQVLQDEKTD